MARQKKQVASLAEVELRTLETVRINDAQILYKELAQLKGKVNYALRVVGQIDECGTIAEAAFKAGRMYGPLDETNDKLELMLESLYEKNDFDHWDDIIDN